MNKYMIKKRWLLIIPLALMLASCGGGGGNPVASGGGGGGGAVTVSDANPSVLSTFTLTISLENVTDLSQAHLELSYNRAIIDVVDINTQIAGIALPLKDKSYDDGVGGTGNLLLSFYNALDGSGPNYTGSGDLCTITFTALSAGTAVISFVYDSTFYVYGDPAAGSIEYPLLISETISVQ